MEYEAVYQHKISSEKQYGIFYVYNKNIYEVNNHTVVYPQATNHFIHYYKIFSNGQFIEYIVIQLTYLSLHGMR